MSGLIRVDADGLAADGRDLAAIGERFDPSACAAPGRDAVSLGASMILDAQQEAVGVLLDYAELVREHGGAIVQNTAIMFVVLDQNNALLINRVHVLHSGGGGAGPGGADPAASLHVPPQPHQPGIPQIPAMPPLPMLPGEELADQLYDGPGSSSIRHLSRDWFLHGSDLTGFADATRAVAAAIDVHWFDGEHNAANNVRSHGRWLDSAAAWAQRLGVGAEGVAHAYDTAIFHCPPPRQFRAAKDNVRYQVQRNRETFGLNTAEVAKAKAEYARLQARAVEAMTAYHESATGALNGIGDPIVPPPLIGKRAVIPHEVVRGPGEWVAERRSGSERSRDYEAQVTGAPAGMEYELPRPDSPLSADFDGYDYHAGPSGLLIEGKGPGYDWMVLPDGTFNPSVSAAADIPRQLEIQYGAAQLAGNIPVEWRVAEPRVAEAIERIIQQQGYDDLITVVVVPPA